jgi:hypothetical protein
MFGQANSASGAMQWSPLAIGLAVIAGLVWGALLPLEVATALVG